MVVLIIMFSVFIKGLLSEVEEAEIGIDLSSGGRHGGLLFADDFVGVSTWSMALVLWHPPLFIAIVSVVSLYLTMYN